MSRVTSFMVVLIVTSSTHIYDIYMVGDFAGYQSSVMKGSMIL